MHLFRRERSFAFELLGSKQNGVIVDGDVIRVFPVTDALPYATGGDCIRLYRQVPRCTQAIHQAVAGPLRGECASSNIPLKISNLTGTNFRVSAT